MSEGRDTSSVKLSAHEREQRKIIAQRCRSALSSYEEPVWRIRAQMQSLEAQREWRAQQRAFYPFHGDDDCPCWLHTGGRQWCWLYRDMECRRQNLAVVVRMVRRLEQIVKTLREARMLLQQANCQDHFTDQWPISQEMAEMVNQITLGINMDCWKYMIDEDIRRTELQEELRYGHGRTQRIDFLTATSFVPERLFQILQVDYSFLLVEQETLRTRQQAMLFELRELDRHIQLFQQQLLQKVRRPIQLTLLHTPSLEEFTP